MSFEDLTFLNPVGKGSFGKVYLTTKLGCDKFLATKIIKKSVADSPKVSKYFHNEINILKEINHKNIMKFIELRETKEDYYLISEYCNGGNLHSCLKEYIKTYSKPFNEEIVQFLMKQIIDALKYLHNNNIMHRDLKLENILLNYDNEYDLTISNIFGAQIKIIDFGFAAHFDNEIDIHKSVLGSPLYMDPIILKKYTTKEKIDGYDEKVDIWSLGNICYQMLIGHCAFETNDVKILEKKIEKGNYNLPTCLHQESISFIIGMLQIDPTIRLSADELSRHKFLKKKFQDFTKINIKNLKNLIEGDKLILNIKEGRLLFNLFNKEYNKVLDIIPEDSEVPEENNKIQVSKSQINVDIKKTKMNISQNKKILKSNTNSIGLKEKLYKIFDKMNKDFLYLPPVFIPVIPGNNPNDDENEEKQI